MQTAPASDRNKGPIWEQALSEILAGAAQTACSTGAVQLLELASGTGQHCSFFASEAAKAGLSVQIQPTEVSDAQFDSIRAWCAHHGVDDAAAVCEPAVLDVTDEVVTTEPEALAGFPCAWEPRTVDVVVCINMIHISPYPDTTRGVFQLAQTHMRPDHPAGRVLLYGPYRIAGEMCESNQAFDESLKSRNPAWGIRNIEDVQEIAAEFGFDLDRILALPANNHAVIFRQQQQEDPATTTDG